MTSEASLQLSSPWPGWVCWACGCVMDGYELIDCAVVRGIAVYWCAAVQTVAQQIRECNVHHAHHTHLFFVILCVCLFRPLHPCYEYRTVMCVLCMHVACCMLYVVCCMLYVACCMLYVACCMLYVVCCMLYVVSCCLLYVVCCMLHVACCVLCSVFCVLYHVVCCMDLAGAYYRRQCARQWSPGLQTTSVTYILPTSWSVSTHIGGGRCKNATDR